MSNVIPFPRRQGLPEAQIARVARSRKRNRAGGEITIPFSREQFLEIAAHLNSASPTLHEEIAQNGGSKAVRDFLRWVWNASEGRLPQPRRGAGVRRGVGPAALALALSLTSALPRWAASPAAPAVPAATIAAFADAEAHFQQLWRDIERDLRQDPQSWSPALVRGAHFFLVAEDEKTAHPVEVDRAVAAWQPTLHAAWWTCEQHRTPDGAVGDSAETFEALFSRDCPGIVMRYNQAEQAVGYVLARREAAADLSTIARAAPPK